MVTTTDFWLSSEVEPVLEAESEKCVLQISAMGRIRDPIIGVQLGAVVLGRGGRRGWLVRYRHSG